MFNSKTMILHDQIPKDKGRNENPVCSMPLHYQPHAQSHLHSSSPVAARAKPQSLRCGIDNKHDNTH